MQDVVPGMHISVIGGGESSTERTTGRMPASVTNGTEELSALFPRPARASFPFARGGVAGVVGGVALLACLYALGALLPFWFLKNPEAGAAFFLPAGITVQPWNAPGMISRFNSLEKATSDV